MVESRQNSSIIEIEGDRDLVGDPKFLDVLVSDFRFTAAKDTLKRPSQNVLRLIVNGISARA